jgi:hypothetical protein
VEEFGTKSRGLVGVALTGLFGGTVVSLWIDRWATGRRRRRDGDPTTAAELQPS